MKRKQPYTQEEIEERIQELLTSGQLYPYAMVEIIGWATKDERVVKAIEPYFESTKFHKIGFQERYYCPIRLVAGFALASEMAAQGYFDPIIVKNTPLSIKPWDKDILEMVSGLQRTFSGTPYEYANNTLEVFEQLYLEGKLRTTDLTIIPGQKYNEYFHKLRWEDLPEGA